MSAAWIAFICGVFIGANVGLVGAAWCFARARHKPGPLDYDAPPQPRLDVSNVYTTHN